MKGKVNMTGVEESKGFVLCEVGEHKMEIMKVVDKTTANGDPMVSIGMVVSEGNSKGAWVWDNITIPLEGSSAIKILGRTKHFLHCISEPYEDNIEYDSDRWLMKELTARVGHEAPNQYHKGIKAIITAYVLDEEVPSVDVSAPPANPDAEDPF